MRISNKRNGEYTSHMPEKTELLNKGANNFWSDLRDHASLHCTVEIPTGLKHKYSS